MSVMNLNNVEIDYLDVGKGDVVVLLHGLGSTKKDYELQIPILKEDYRIIAPDFRAHGNSTKTPKEQGVEIMALDVALLLKELKIIKAHFVGFSMGGAVALELAFSYPELVDKMVLINTAPDFNTSSEVGVDLLEERTQLIKQHGFESLAHNIAFNMYPESGQMEWREEFANRVLANDEKAYLHTFGELMKWGLGEKLKQLSNATLVVASDMDYTPVEYKRKYTERMQNAVLSIIPNSRHGVVVDQAELLNKELLKFLKNG